ncbi:cyclodeaminase [Aestuariicoccus sp. MJ-SS9]|uniref:cyclodeaminase n=1 Tax=Aestuariicoccus sp. MJ-SS9 TaxID=3079855 RepID=UPI002912BFAC|nr:cyclodeaminase [Aestuariicoccus sp. MJ-SS9]MDU8910780.1 cyclodeaminase [Aestuariicoccus sp. MJ-SS9]
MPHDIRVVTETELRELVKLDLDLVNVVEQAFVALGRGDVIMPPIMSMELPQLNAEVDAKTAFIPGFDGFALKVSTGFFDNPKRGLPSLGGLMTLLSATDGAVRAVFLDNGFLTDMRTAAAGAVAARHLAPETVTTAGVIGTGLQARLQMRAAHLVRPFERVLVWGRDLEKATLCAADLGRDIGVEAEVCTDPAVLMKRAQLVVTTTPSFTPIVQAGWLHPELHITAMGSDAPDKCELAPEALARADLYVADSAAQVETRGELRTALERGVWPGTPVTELGPLILGAQPGRNSARDTTIADLTGTGAQDTAIATHVFARLGDAGTLIST